MPAAGCRSLRLACQASAGFRALVGAEHGGVGRTQGGAAVLGLQGRRAVRDPSGDSARSLERRSGSTNVDTFWGGSDGKNIGDGAGGVRDELGGGVAPASCDSSQIPLRFEPLARAFTPRDTTAV